MKQQLFILDRDMLYRMSDTEVNKTFFDMVELGIAHPPYPDLTIQVPAGAVMSTYNKMAVPGDGKTISWDEAVQSGAMKDPVGICDMPCRFVYTEVSLAPMPTYDCEMLVDVQSDGRWKNVGEYLKDDDQDETISPFLESFKLAAGQIHRMLIVLLATKNVKREVVHNKLAKFGYKRKVRGGDYAYTTTLRIGLMTEDAHDAKREASGEHRRPHLRRGHVRNQAYGPGLAYHRKIFIQPVFVNGYVDEVDGRSAYNVHMEKANG